MPEKASVQGVKVLLSLSRKIHTFGWLQVRGVDTLDGVNGLRIEITPGVG